MNTPFKKLTDFLIHIGVEQVGHSEKSYLAHLIGVYQDLKRAGCSEEVACAGMFHSIYGTQRFQGFKLPLEQRAAVRDLIGERAERLAYLNCAMERDSFDRAVADGSVSHRILDRITQEWLQLSKEDFDDLCRVHLYDWLEQVPRSREWEYRRATYRGLAERLGGNALGAFDAVYAQAAK